MDETTVNAGGEVGTEQQGSAQENSDLSTAERALEFWEKPEPVADQKGGDAEKGGNSPAAAANGGADQNAQGKDAGADAQVQDAISDEQLQANPKYQELETFRNDVQLLMEQHNIPDQKELGLQLADATVLYAIAQGKAPASALLDTMIQNGAWGREQVQGVAGNLIDWLTKNGFLKDGQAQGGGAQARGADGKFKDPLEERLDRVERERQEQRDREAQGKQETERKAYQEKIFKSYTGKVGELMKAAGLVDDKGNVDPEQLDFYGREIRALIPQSVFDAVCKRIEKGNFVDVKKHFDTIHNKELARLQKYNNTLTKNHERKEKTTPRVSSGGGTPPPAGQQKRNLRNREDRIAAAEAEWSK